MIRNILKDEKARREASKEIAQKHRLITITDADHKVFVFKEESAISMACDEETALSRAFEDLQTQ